MWRQVCIDSLGCKATTNTNEPCQSTERRASRSCVAAALCCPERWFAHVSLVLTGRRGSENLDRFNQADGASPAHEAGEQRWDDSTFINIDFAFLTTLTEATSSGASLKLHTQLFQTGIQKVG